MAAGPQTIVSYHSWNHTHKLGIRDGNFTCGKFENNYKINIPDF